MTQPIESHTLRDGDTEIQILSIGCAVQSWTVAGRSVVLGCADPEDYRSNPVAMGIVVGRVANRISGAEFTLNGQTYPLTTKSPDYQIHGGPGGVGWCNWDMSEKTDTSVLLSLTSPDGDQGFPGQVDFSIRMSLQGGKLTWDMTGLPDCETPINLAQHVYFNLSGTADVWDHSFEIDADRHTPNTKALMPTGEILDVTGTRYDFRQSRKLADVDPDKVGYDLNFALNGGDGHAAEVLSGDGMRFRLWTDRPGLQLYTSNTLRPFGTPLAGQNHAPFSGFCLEAQDFPNALNTPGFGSIICTPEAPYRQVTAIEILPVDTSQK